MTSFVRDTTAGLPRAARASAPRRRIWSAVAGVVAVISMLGLGVLATASPASAAGVSPPTSAAATAAGLSSVTVSWKLSPDPAVVRYQIGIVQTSGWTSIGTRYACGTCTSVTIDGLRTGTTYTFPVQAVTAAGATSSAAWPVITTPSGPCSGTSGICISVDTNRSVGALSHAASGFNLGFNGGTPQSIITPLAPKYWRISPTDKYAHDYVRQVGALPTVLLSNGWAANNINPTTGKLTKNPWQDWNAYRNYIVNAINYSIANNILPEAWEIQNEPDMPGLFNTTSPPTRSLLLQQFQIAHDAIRSVLPSAKVVGPSVGAFEYLNPNSLLDMTSFLDFAVANNLQFDVISFHELGKYQYGDVEADPRAVMDHVSQLRALLAARPSLGQPQISVNEYGAPWYQNDPGAVARYVMGLETAGASSAAASCYPVAWTSGGKTKQYDTCVSSPGLLDGLRAPDGSTNSSYWVHASYAGMTGNRLDTATTDQYTSAVSSISSTGVIKVLIGRAHGCITAIQQYCPNKPPDATATAQLAIATVGGANASYQVTLKRMPNIGGLSAPIQVGSWTIGAAYGVVTVPVPDGIADGDALIAELVPTTPSRTFAVEPVRISSTVIWRDRPTPTKTPSQLKAS